MIHCGAIDGIVLWKVGMAQYCPDIASSTLGAVYSCNIQGRIYRVSHDTGHLENLAKSQTLYKHELDT